MANILYAFVISLTRRGNVATRNTSDLTTSQTLVKVKSSIREDVGKRNLMQYKLRAVVTWQRVEYTG
jgi:hypothetical protein